MERRTGVKVNPHPFTPTHCLQSPARTHSYLPTRSSDRKERNFYIQLAVRLEGVELQTAVAGVSCPVQNRDMQRQVVSEEWGYLTTTGEA